MNTKSTDDTHSTQLTEPPNSHWPEVRRASASSASTTAKPFVQKHRNSRLRSTGCKTCRQRKIKCDEQKPVCKNCTKSHRTCLGYVNFDTFVFTHETGRSEQAVLESQMQDSLFDYGQPVASGDISTQRRDSDLSMTSDDQQYIDSSWYGPTSHGDSESLPALDSMRDEAHASAPAGSSLQQSPALQFEAFFYERFINSVWLHSQADAWQFYLPLAMRNSPALYYSVMSLSALYMAKTGVEPRARRFALSLYQGTLSQLQKALYDPAKALQDETLMATVIIGLYELIDKPGHNSWASHSRGTAELMKMRGSSAVRTGIGKMLFLTLRGYEVVRAILQYQDTFVADEIWTIESSSGQTIRASNGLLRETAETKDSAMHPSPDYAAVLFMLGGQVANLQALCARSANQADAQPDFAKSLLDQASSIESRLKHWRNSLPQDYDAPDFAKSVAPSSSNKMQNAHALTIGYQLCFYSAFLILLHRVVAKYIHHDLSRVNADVESLGRFIVMTARYLTQGQTTVSLNVTWPMYMASISLSRQEEKSWSLDILRSISRDKGWAAATSALTAATVAAHKSRLREAAKSGAPVLEHKH